MQSLTRLFADDSSLAATGNNVSDIETKLNSDLQNVSTWAKTWLVDFNPSKTEVLFISKTIYNKPKLFFDNKELGFVDSHKHLGVTLCDDGKWHQHIQCITSSASKILGTMRALKYSLNRNTLNHIYVAFLRPVLEYASIVWDNCTEYDKADLERIQYEAARTITGLTKSVSNAKLLKEIGWITLEKRREMQKLLFIFKYKLGLTPAYINDIIPPLVNEISTYNLRNSNNFVTLPQRTSLYASSVIPSCTVLWNNLEQDIKNSDSLNSFKTKLNSKFYSLKSPEIFSYGQRCSQIYHARIRNNCSNLNADLFNNFLKASPECPCGDTYEDAEHFFFKCPLYSTERLNLFIHTRQYHPLSVDKLCFGISGNHENDNKNLFAYVHRFIKDTKRFTTE